MDNAKNFAKVTVLNPYGSGDTSIVLQSGNGALLPSVPFNVVWWNSTDYTDPTDDPNKEIVRVTNIATDTLTVTRNQEGSGASTKNNAGKTYKMIAGLTAKAINTDLGTAAFTAITLVNGANQNVNLASVPVGVGGILRIRITGPSAAFNIGGFTNGADGLMLIVLNDSIAFAMTLNNADGGSTAANRIKTLTGGNVAIGSTNGAVATLMYDSNVSLWVLLATQGT